MQLEYVRGDKREKVDLHKKLLQGEQKVELMHTFVNKSKFFMVKDTKQYQEKMAQMLLHGVHSSGPVLIGQRDFNLADSAGKFDNHF